jgi:hypothetical protein
MLSTRWKRGVVTNSSTFLNQERWKDIPAAAPVAPSRPGESKVRETTDAEKRDADLRAPFMWLARSSPAKSETEIEQMEQG